jgi:hypothetical protein
VVPLVFAPDVVLVSGAGVGAGVVVVVVVLAVVDVESVAAVSSRLWQAVSDAAAIAAMTPSWAILRTLMLNFLVERAGGRPAASRLPGRGARRRPCRAGPDPHASNCGAGGAPSLGTLLAQVQHGRGFSSQEPPHKPRHLPMGGRHHRKEFKMGNQSNQNQNQNPSQQDQGNQSQKDDRGQASQQGGQRQGTQQPGQGTQQPGQSQGGQSDRSSAADRGDQSKPKQGDQGDRSSASDRDDMKSGKQS